MSWLNYLIRGYKDVLNIFYPRFCISCEHVLHPNEDFICHQCASKLIRTNYGLDAENPIYDRLSAIIPIKSASALFLFDKQGVVQQLIHQLKYHGAQEVGQLMANYVINFYDDNSFRSQFDYIIPVPLHPEKQKQRGYNQLTLFGKNLGNYYSIQYTENILLRHQNTSSQTMKSADQRRRNVAEAFSVAYPEFYSKKRFLLVDDVLTTGATLEACIESLLKAVPDAQVSVLTMAVVL